MACEIITAKDSARLIKDGSVVVTGGNGGMAPEAIYEAIETRFLETGKPRDITLLHPTGIGAADANDKGLNHFAHKGLVKRVIGGNYGIQLQFMKKLITTNDIEAYNFPQGVLSQMFRAISAKQPGVITHVGLHSYIDPRQEGGKMTACTKEDLIEIIELSGQEWLFYKVPVPNIAFIRGTTADQNGYISMEHEPATREDLSIAMAVHNSGGIVVCQVERMARSGSLNPHLVRIPGCLINYVVVDKEQWQTYGTRFNPSVCGETTSPVSAIVPDPLNERRVMARRAAFELRPGEVINLGVGVSAGIPNVAAEEGIADLVTFTVEAGVIGGVPGSYREFGTAQNPLVIIDQPYQFDFYDGGGLDTAFLSFAEVDSEGNVNVTRFGNRNDGAGGFINISQNAKKLVFSGTLTGGGLKTDIINGRLKIKKEGRYKKFVSNVGQISYNGRLGRKRNQPVLFITARGVFKLTNEGFVLIEIAPGISLQEDIIDKIDFEIKISPDLKKMDTCLFHEGPMGLKEIFGS